MNLSNTLRSQAVVAQFRELDLDAPRDVIKFYDMHRSVLPHLDARSGLEIELSYNFALFEVSHYESFLQSAQYLLEAIIEQNIKVLNGEDVYEKLLLKKAAAHYQLLELHQAEKILWQLIRMNPDQSSAIFLLKRCLMRNQPEYLLTIKGICIFLLLLTATLIGGELLFVRPFWPQYTAIVELSRTIILVSGVGVLFLAEIGYQLRTHQVVNSAVRRCKQLRQLGS